MYLWCLRIHQPAILALLRMYFAEANAGLEPLACNGPSCSPVAAVNSTLFNRDHCHAPLVCARYIMPVQAKYNWNATGVGLGCRSGAWGCQLAGEGGPLSASRIDGGSRTGRR